MKKFMLIIAALVSLSLASCGGKNSEQGDAIGLKSSTYYTYPGQTINPTLWNTTANAAVGGGVTWKQATENHLGTLDEDAATGVGTFICTGFGGRATYETISAIYNSVTYSARVYSSLVASCNGDDGVITDNSSKPAATLLIGSSNVISIKYMYGENDGENKGIPSSAVSGLSTSATDMKVEFDSGDEATIIATVDDSATASVQKISFSINGCDVAFYVNITK